MATHYQVNYQCNSGEAGYALQFYSQSSSLSTALSKAMEPQILDAITNCMPGTAEVYRVVVRGQPDLSTTLVQQRGDEDDRFPKMKGQATTRGGRAGNTTVLHPDGKSEAVQIILRGSKPTKRYAWFHFLPDEWLVGSVLDGTRDVDPSLRILIRDNLIPEIVSRFAIRYRIRADTTGFGYINVSYLTCAQQGFATKVTCSQAHGLQNGQYVTFEGYNRQLWTKNLRGKHRVSDVDTLSFTIPVSYQNVPVKITDSTGAVLGEWNPVKDLRVRRLAYALDDITEGNIALQRAKRIGRSFRGRKAHKHSASIRHSDPLSGCM